MNRTKNLILILTTFLFVSCSSTPISIDGDTVVKLQRSACFGKCPIYTVAVKKNGEVIYEGHKYVFVEGIQTAVLSKESIASIEDQLIKYKFLKMTSNLSPGARGCSIFATDHSYILIEGAVKNKRKAISTYLGCNSEQVESAIELASQIDKIAETSKWVETNTQKAP
jgi:hypothetical protein